MKRDQVITTLFFQSLCYHLMGEESASKDAFAAAFLTLMTGQPYGSTVLQ